MWDDTYICTYVRMYDVYTSDQWSHPGYILYVAQLAWLHKGTVSLESNPDSKTTYRVRICIRILNYKKTDNCYISNTRKHTAYRLPLTQIIYSKQYQQKLQPLARLSRTTRGSFRGVSGVSKNPL